MTTGSDPAQLVEHPVVLFDGVCNLCARSVQWILRHEADGELRFASLQSEAAAEVLRSVGMDVPEGDPDSVVLVEDGVAYVRSTAALRVARHLRWPWRAAVALRVVPRPVRDAGYRTIARNRYRWFGKQDECWVPTPALRARFLDRVRPTAA